MNTILGATLNAQFDSSGNIVVPKVDTAKVTTNEIDIGELIRNNPLKLLET